MDWIGLAQDSDRWRTLVSALMNLRVPWNAGNFLTSCKPISCSRMTLHHGVSKYYSGAWCRIRDVFGSVTAARNLLSDSGSCVTDDTVSFRRRIEYSSLSLCRPQGFIVPVDGRYLWFYCQYLFERKILRSIFGPTQKANGEWRLKTNEELEKAINKENIVRYIKYKRLNWLGHVERMTNERVAKTTCKWKPYATRP